MPVFPKHFSIPRNGQLVALTVRNADDLRKVRTELELLRRVNRQMLIRTMAAGQTLPGQYSMADNVELKHILNDASHPLVRENISQIDQEFENIGKDIMMSVINDEADNFVYEAIETGATIEQDETNTDTSPSVVAEQIAASENPDAIPESSAINDDLMRATAELAEIVGMDLSNTETMEVPSEDQGHSEAIDESNHNEAAATDEDATASIPTSDDASKVMVTTEEDESSEPLVLSDGTSGDAGETIEVEATAIPEQNQSIESEQCADTQSVEEPQDLAELEDQSKPDNQTKPVDQTPQDDIDPPAKCATTECIVANEEGEACSESVEQDNSESSAETTQDSCDSQPAEPHQNDNTTNGEQPNVESEESNEEASNNHATCDDSMDNVSTGELVQDELATNETTESSSIEPSSTTEDHASTEETPEQAEVSNDGDTVEIAGYTPESAEEMLEVLQQGLRKLTDMLSSQVSEDWHRASDAMADILKKQEQVEAAVQDAVSLVADLSNLKTEATEARDAILAALEETKNSSASITPTEKCKDEAVASDEASSEPIKEPATSDQPVEQTVSPSTP